MAVSTYVKVKRDGVLTLMDGTGSPNTFDVTYTNGDLKFSDAADDEVVIRNRGSIVGVRAGDSPVLSGSFSVHFREWTNAALTLVDVLQGVGSASGWTKVNYAFEQFNLDVKLVVAKGADGGVTAPTATLSTCIFTWDFSEADPDSIAVSFNCYEGIAYLGNT